MEPNPTILNLLKCLLNSCRRLDRGTVPKTPFRECFRGEIGLRTNCSQPGEELGEHSVSPAGPFPFLSEQRRGLTLDRRARSRARPVSGKPLAPVPSPPLPAP